VTSSSMLPPDESVQSPSLNIDASALMAMPAAVQIWQQRLLLVISFSAAIFAAWWGIVSTQITAVENALLEWELSPTGPSSEQTASVLRRAQFVQHLAPFAPETNDLLGRTALWIASRDGAGTLAAAQMAERSFQASLRWRPSWPYTWLNLAQAQRILYGNSSPNWLVSLRNALASGARGLTLQKQLMRLRAAAADDIPPDVAQQMQSMLDQELPTSSSTLIPLADYLGHLDWTCAGANRLSFVQDACARRGWQVDENKGANNP
jgi:hypothetical protein